MLEIDKLILIAIEKDCIDVVELLLKNRDKLCYASLSDDDQMWRSDLLGKVLELEKANPNLPLKEGFLKQAENLFNAGDILYLYMFPPDNFDPMDISKDLIKHYLDKADSAKELIDNGIACCSPLILAVCNEDMEMAELLLKYGADANICMRSELSEYGANTNVSDDYDGPVLGVALEKGNQEVIKLLQKYGASTRRIPSIYAVGGILTPSTEDKARAKAIMEGTGLVSLPDAITRIKETKAQKKETNAEDAKPKPNGSKFKAERVDNNKCSNKPRR
jgi:ankyrin repeat protein